MTRGRVLLTVIASTLAMSCLAGCGPKVTKVEATGPAVVKEDRQSCSHAGYCFTCMPGFDGKMNCGFKFSAMCSGTQDVTYSETPVRRYYEDGSTRNSVDTTTISTGFCS